MKPDLVVIGHMAKDIQPDGSFFPGGTITYAALVAQRLGLQVGVVTSAAPEDSVFLRHAIPDAQLAILPSLASTIFENKYVAGERHQRLLSRASDITEHAIPLEWLDAPLTLFGPIADEIPLATVQAVHSRWRMATPQGWLRAWNEKGVVSAKSWVSLQDYLKYVTVMVLSVEDLAHAPQSEILNIFDDWSKQVAILALTDGPRGATIWSPNLVRMHVPAFPVNEVDPTGAGDSFAIGLLYDLWHSGGDALHAAQFAHAIASYVVESKGISGIPSLETIVQRMHDTSRQTPQE